MKKRNKLIAYTVILVMLFSLFCGNVPASHCMAETAVYGVTQRDWSKYGSRHFYNNLNAEQKAMYDAMDKVCRGILDGTGKVDPNTYISEGVPFYGNSYESMLIMANAFVYENPQYYFINKNFTYTDYEEDGKTVYDKFYFKISPELVDSEARANVTNQVFGILDDYISQVSGSTDYEKMVSVCQIICNNTSSSSDMEKDPVDYKYRSIYSPLVLKKGVCNGYSKVASAMLNAVGVDNAIMLNEGSTHGWLKVCIDGKWYNTDAYWADKGTTLAYRYIAVSDATIRTYDSEKNEHLIRSTHLFNPAANEDYPKDASGNASNSSGSNSGKYSSEWVDGKWYNADGTQTYKGSLQWKCDSTGWWVEDSSGWYPVSQWQKIDGKWYYFLDSGYMDYSEYRDGYWLGSDGALVDGYYGQWKSDSKGWWFEDTSGWYPQSQWLWIDGVNYYFGADGYMW